jgi:DNA-binding NarL/FixJ family response regulator
MRSSARARVVLADDYPNMLTALKRLLHPSYVVVGTVLTGAQALDAIGRLEPDVLVIDLMLPDINGLEVCRRVMSLAVPTKVIVLTAADDLVVAHTALEYGASAFVSKYRLADDLIPAIDQALNARALGAGDAHNPRTFSGHPVK